MPPSTAVSLVNPYTRLAVGRDVCHSGTARFTLMWTATSIATQPSQFTPNHFVLLIDRRPQDSVVVSEQDNVVDETQQVPSDDSVQSD